ncbi:MAG: proton-conducting transporter membrane subunit [Dehalococcoidia bacterium]|nr:proton-conducting transporter membrane subunit [Dehalococcoidia bacterium]
MLVIALAFVLLGGMLALLLGRSARAATVAGVAGAVIGGAFGIAGAALTLASRVTVSMRVPWHVPYGELYLAVDPLSAVFLLAIFGLSAVAAAYGATYLAPYGRRRSLGTPWFFFSLLVASMAVVVMARNGILFLMAWEVMAVSSFFLVVFEHEKPEVRSAGWTYLIATHIGTAFLLAFFALLGREAGSLDFDRFAALSSLAPATASLLFLLALVGFGAKAGLVPFHVWLPEAHPAAPSHVSAVMSGVMIKTGVYGILRALTFLGPPPAWWGVLLIGVGLASALIGLLLAAGQHDLKRLLAYHSVENIGIIIMATGIGVWGLSHNAPSIALLAFSAALLHTVGHAAVKGMLFMGAGAVLHATGERDIDRLGGLLKRMPQTGTLFLVGGAALVGMPPLSAFVSEFLLMVASLRSVEMGGLVSAAPALGVVTGLALAGGLAVATLTKAIGITFLGAPRSDHAAHAHSVGAGLWLPMAFLAAVSVFIGVGAPVALGLVLPGAEQLVGTGAGASDALAVAALLSNLSIVALVLVALVAALALLRGALLRTRRVDTAVTWDCGYENPTPRMQYTSLSFAGPLLDIFPRIFGPRRRVEEPVGYFPQGASLRSEAQDVFLDRLYRPAFEWISLTSFNLRWLQHGRVHLYLLYIFITLVVLLVWQLGLRGDA